VNERVGKADLVIAVSPDSAAVLVWESGGLEFDAAGPGQMKDRETGSLWSIFSGICRDGKKKGEKLIQRAGISILVSRFRAFWPAGRIF